MCNVVLSCSDVCCLSIKRHGPRWLAAAILAEWNSEWKLCELSLWAVATTPLPDLIKWHKVAGLSYGQQQKLDLRRYLLTRQLPLAFNIGLEASPWLDHYKYWVGCCFGLINEICVMQSAKSAFAPIFVRLTGAR